MTGRYSRQIILPEIGTSGQRRLSSAKVAVIGAGGLGSPALYYLASAGVGQIKIIDSDSVDITNLNRQFLHSDKDIGREKAYSAKEKLESYNREIEVSVAAVRLDVVNAREHLQNCDAVLSCVDNNETRYLLNGVCVKEGIPLIDGGVGGFDGYILRVIPGKTPCYQCVFPRKREEPGSSGILGATAGVLGSMMAMEAVKHLVGIANHSHFHHVDLLSYRITPIKGKKVAHCPACGS